ncbi:thiol-disulfide oxidoreductase DCC family protein [Rhizobium leguminosarum]|jgi:predicted DCC family thiol-disulfide oxidoreductase YuxK|uniref:thiol-disulfide oxidoreductase DCC family protein n=1 Tax=Rhizobium leguminosarum TaxID=384 RepID=UPI0024B3C508|nr:DCC1-like thiol-disulfide oxidoreductase family protein [Rhizobium leguminosarum]WHO78763.1 DCC1-like thiol-disulfide oxidoreductase family protein [Rhizobium leguminosarum]
MTRAAYSYRSDADVPDFADDQPLIVFDGECVFCSGWVKFVLKHDKQQRYRFLAAQTPLGTALYRHYGLDARDYETNILIEEGRGFFKSDGTIRMVAGLGFPYSLVKIFRLLPRRVADALYEFIARNRLKIAGRQSCMVPTPEQRRRFVS